MRVSRPGRAAAVGAVLVVLIATGCGPSDDEVRADLADICDETVTALEALPAEPSFAELPGAAEEAWSALLGATDDIGDLDAGDLGDEVDDLEASMRELEGAYFDIGYRIEERDYAALAETQQTGEAATAAVVEVARDAGVPECEEIGARAEYFSIATAGGEAVAADIAPTGDYVADVDAACARFAEDTAEVFLRLGLQSALDVEIEPDAGDYIQAVEDRSTITRALRSLVRELQAVPPPAGDEAAADELLAGFEQVLQGFEDLDAADDTAPIGEGFERVATAAEQLGVACSV